MIDVSQGRLTIFCLGGGKDSNNIRNGGPLAETPEKCFTRSETHFSVVKVSPAFHSGYVI